MTLESETTWRHRDLVELESPAWDESRLELATAEAIKDVSTRSTKRTTELRGGVMVTLFFAASTRTRTSSTLAAQRLSADVREFSARGSSVAKGESLQDTA